MLMVMLLVVGLTNEQIVWCERLILGEPTTHVIQDGEYLSVIAKKYYGNADYWRELALINRAPNSNLVFPGEEIIVPKKAVIEQIKRTRRLSLVNQFVKGEEDILARLKNDESQKLALDSGGSESAISEGQSVMQTADEQTAAAEDSRVERSSSVYMILLIIGIVLLAATITLLIYRKRKADQEINTVRDAEFSEEQPEPGYDDYIDKREKSRQYVVETN